MNKIIFKQKVAFTLAEVLITLGIIGVVAALTIPTLLSATEKSEFYNKFISTYAILHQASTMVLNEYGGNLTSQFTTQDELALAFSQHLKTTRICLNSKSAPDRSCWNSANKHNLTNDLTMTGWADNPSGGIYWPVLFLQNGVVVGFISNRFSDDCSGTANQYTDPAGRTHYTCSIIMIDVNGDKGPNLVGRDLQVISIPPDIPIIPVGIPGTASNYNTRCNPVGTPSTFNGYDCAGKLFTERKMDY